MTRRDAPGGPVLVIDTATTHAVVALGSLDGTLLAERGWVAGYRHGEELLARIDTLLLERGLTAGALGGIVVGTGPGAFTGLRVGLATAKGLAFALGLPVVGVATGEALLAAAAAAGAEAPSTKAPGTKAPGTKAAGPRASDSIAAGPEIGRGRSASPSGLVLVQPAGPSDLVLTRSGERPRIVPGGADPGVRPGEQLVAVDVAGRADERALARGAAAVAGLATALLRAGAERLAAGQPDDLITLVPEYVTLPRGVRAAVPDAAVAVTHEGDEPSRTVHGSVGGDAR